jgi:hypothetical protein
VLSAMKDDCVQGAVELAIAAAAEPVTNRLAARGGHGCDARETREGGFRANAARMRPSDDHVGGNDRTDACLGD